MVSAKTSFSSISFWQYQCHKKSPFLITDFSILLVFLFYSQISSDLQCCRLFNSVQLADFRNGCIVFSGNL